MWRAAGSVAVLLMLVVVVRGQPPRGPNALVGPAPSRRPTTWTNFREVNAARAEGDAPALIRMTPALEAAAHAFARDYWNNWANDALFGTLNKGIGSDGSTPASRVQREAGGAKFCNVQQLALAGPIQDTSKLPSLAEGLKISMESADKQAVILAPKATDMGLAILANGKWEMFVLVVANPC